MHADQRFENASSSLKLEGPGNGDGDTWATTGAAEVAPLPQIDLRRCNERDPSSLIPHKQNGV
jgi:hypothetical protein